MMDLHKREKNALGGPDVVRTDNNASFIAPELALVVDGQSQT